MICHLAGKKAVAVAQAQSTEIQETKRRFLDKSMADGRGGRHSQGVRWWIIFMVYGHGLSPKPDARYMRIYPFAMFIEDKLEDMIIWLAVFRPSGIQCSHTTLGKYASSVRGWYRREERSVFGLGAQGSRINDILKGYARDVPQPPKLERVGCTP